MSTRVNYQGSREEWTNENPGSQLHRRSHILYSLCARFTPFSTTFCCILSSCFWHACHVPQCVAVEFVLSRLAVFCGIHHSSASYLSSSAQRSRERAPQSVAPGIPRSSDPVSLFPSVRSILWYYAVASFWALVVPLRSVLFSSGPFRPCLSSSLASSCTLTLFGFVPGLALTRLLVPLLSGLVVQNSDTKRQTTSFPVAFLSLVSPLCRSFFFSLGPRCLASAILFPVILLCLCALSYFSSLVPSSYCALLSSPRLP